MNTQYHHFHIIFPSPWPLLTGSLAMNSLMSIIIMINFKASNILLLNSVLLTIAALVWWRDVSRESSLQGFHSITVMAGLRMGMILFIISEILFFTSFFWMFFHNSLAPNMELGSTWPPLGVSAMNPFQIPLLNTIILLSSGMSVTWAHHSLIENDYKKTKVALFWTIILGVYFTLLQAWEYWDASFSFADSTFGSSFFLATGFHGLHVFIGTLFLITALLRLKMNFFSFNHHIGFEMAIWYWHFVDVVWLFLYTFLYWWSY